MAHAWANACLIGVRSHSRVHIGRWRPAWRGPRHAHDLSRSSCCVESSVRASSSIDYCNYTRVLRSTGLRLRVSVYFLPFTHAGDSHSGTGFMPRIHMTIHVACRSDSEPSMGPSGHSGGRQGRPRGRLVAPNGSPRPPKCEVQYLLSEQPTFLRTASAGDVRARTPPTR